MIFRHLLPSLVLVLLAIAPVAAEPMIGIGVALGIDPSGQIPVVTQVFPNTPAEKAGLPGGAVIEKINGIATAGRTLEACIAQIRGPEGIPVLLEFVDPATGTSKKLMIVRGKFNVGGRD